MNLTDFVLKAKLAGYAAGNRNKEIRFEDGARGYEYTDGRYNYTDHYHGSNPFAGTEYVRQDDGTLVWLMHYYGRTTTARIDQDAIYSFLKEAMLLVTPQYPFRGPREYEMGGFRYENKQNGTMDRFHGTETILCEEEQAYLLYYHGGGMR